MTTFCSVARISKIAAAAAIFSVTSLTVQAAQAADNWLACEGTVATSTTKDGKTETASASANDVYVFNDGNKMLFKYADVRKALDPVFVTKFDDKTIAWANAGGASAGTTAATWQGSLDRASMALKMTRTERDEVMTWTQQCKSTAPKPTGAK
jgi:hypothetical protein